MSEEHGSASRAIDKALCFAGNIFVNLLCIAGAVLIAAISLEVLDTLF